MECQTNSNFDNYSYLVIWLLWWQLSKQAIKPEVSLKPPLYCLSNQYKINTKRRGKEKEKLWSNRTFPNPFFNSGFSWSQGLVWFGLVRDNPSCLWAKSGLYPGQVSSLSHLHSYSDLRPMQNSKFTPCASLWTLGGSWTTLEETHWTQDERVNSTHLFNFRLEN